MAWSKRWALDEDGKRKAPPSGRAHVVGLIRFFEHPQKYPCHTFCSVHQTYQRSERHPPILSKHLKMTACRQEAGPATSRQSSRNARPAPPAGGT